MSIIIIEFTTHYHYDRNSIQFLSAFDEQTAFQSTETKQH